jgi:diacylglycerol O-acyltransferase / wax synthase
VQRLSGTDSLFLAGETASWHQHVAGLSIIDPTGVPDFSFDTVVRRIDDRLAAIPKLTWKLRETPLHLDRAVWVPDPDFDVRRHVRRIVVPEPGGPRETAAVVGELLGRQLDRRRPLWEIWYLDGVINGRVGFVFKYHHCLLDGVAGSGLAAVLLDIEPEPAPLPTPPRPDPEPEPSAAHLIAASVVPTLAVPWRLMRYGARLARRGVGLAAYAASRRPKPDVSAMVQAPRTSFNHTIGPRRAIAFTSVAFDDLKALQRIYDVKLNDVALAVCSGALRIYLEGRDELPNRTLTAGIPASTRTPGDETLENKISYMVVPLATNVCDPGERVRAIYAHTRAVKELSAAVRAHPIESAGTAMPPWMLELGMRAAYESHLLSYVPGMMNALISNVAGPPFPLYLAGAPLTGIFTASVILEGMGVNITVFSFHGRFDFGIHVDPDLVPEPWDLAAAVQRSLAEWMDAAGIGAPTPVRDPFGLETV